MDTGVINNASASTPQPSPQEGDTGVSYSQLDLTTDLDASVSGLRLTFAPYLRWVFWSSAFVLTAVISAALGATLALVTPLSPLIKSHSQPQNSEIPQNQPTASDHKSWRKSFPYNLSRPVNILVMGIDRVPDALPGSPEVFGGRSDTLLLLRLDPKDHSVNMLSIPRDTRIEIPGVGIVKINDANVKGGSTLTAEVVSRTLNDVPIDRYVRITTDAFRELVDLVGGLEVFVPERMEYVDVTQKLEIDLEPGWQTLNGDQAEQFARYRKDNGDIARIQRQQILLKALRQRLVTPSVVPRLPKILRVMQQYIDTNLSLEEILALVGFGLEVGKDNIRMVLLPGRFSNADEYIASYWLMNSRGRDRVMSEYFEQEPKYKSSLKRRRSPHRVRIAVQNATDDPELGRRVARYLARHDFYNVYYVSDWPDRLSQTEIIVQQGDIKTADIVKKVLGLGRVEASSTGHLKSELTIRVGEDWLEREF
ncbi:MAG: LCP family protein [Moorea sp. SIO1G6]|uniref:LCP family protein n=1 Tax=Moorena sp. SIO1G6 TaxID=2607840 RepID=UPI0013BFA1A6|nr:LCP family protein [Moorena sp. SIO1G6]NET63256.1 LCP family protein [Moorena sp. SIO1G6]